MATNLASIQKELGVDGGWQDLYRMNKSVVNNPQLLSQAYNTQGSQSFDPIAEVVNPIVENIKTPEETFREKYPMEQFMPDPAIMQFAEQQVNPEYYRMAREQLGGYDTGANISGAYRTGESMRGRQAMLDQVDRERKGAMQEYIQAQKNLFNDWYSAEMQSYMTDPSKYVMTGYENQPWYMGTGGSSAYNEQGQPLYDYSYNPVDFQSYFQYGGYQGRRPIPAYNQMTKTSATYRSSPDQKRYLPTIPGAEGEEQPQSKWDIISNKFNWI